MAISWKWPQIAQKWSTRQIWGCFQHLENFLSPGTQTVCSIDFGNSISFNPVRSGSCSSWQYCRTQLVLQLCQLHHLLTRSSLGDNLCRSSSVRLWSRRLIQSRARRRGRPARHLSASWRPYAGVGPARQVVGVGMDATTPRTHSVPVHSLPASLSLALRQAKVPSPLPPWASRAPHVLAAASCLTFERLRIRLEHLHLLHPSVGRDLPEVSDCWCKTDLQTQRANTRFKR